MPDTVLLGTLLLTGLVGSFGHCVGMCGPLVMAVSLKGGSLGVPPVRSALLLQGGRVLTYTVLGGAMAEAASIVGRTASLRQGMGGVTVLLGLAVTLLGFGYLGWLRPGWAGSGGALGRAMGMVIRLGGWRGFALLGVLNGLLPCGMVYGAYLAAASSGSWQEGAIGMLIFGLATIPALLLVGMAPRVLGVKNRQALVRVAGGLVLALGLQLILRGMAALALVPHLRFGSVVLW